MDNFKINSKGYLEIGGCSAVELAEQFGTPLYVLDEYALRDACKKYRKAFEAIYDDVEIHFAAKALLNTAVCHIIRQEGLGLDVASAGELHTALNAGFPVELISMNGNYKSDFELTMAVSAGIENIIVDNLLELENLQQVCRRLKKTTDILLRLAPGIDPDTHEFISTGQADTKFGLNIKDGSAMEALEKALKISEVNVSGYHCHVGSQLLDCQPVYDGAVELARFAAEANKEFGITPKILNVGGGLGIRYLQEHEPPDFNLFANELVGALKSALTEFNLPLPKLMLEPGRSIVGEAGATLYTIGPVKTVPITDEPGKRTYVAVDGGLSDNPRPVMYDAVYRAVVANKADQTPDTLVTVSGKHCETDTLIKDILLADPQPGDVLAVYCTGAYNYAMSSNYNRFMRPAMVLANNGFADVIVERETLEDLLSKDRVPERLKK